MDAHVAMGKIKVLSNFSLCFCDSAVSFHILVSLWYSFALLNAMFNLLNDLFFVRAVTIHHHHFSFLFLHSQTIFDPYPASLLFGLPLP